MQVNDTGSLSVNLYRWINIWTAILGQFLSLFPAFFEIRRILEFALAANFTYIVAGAAFLFCIFTPLTV